MDAVRRGTLWTLSVVASSDRGSVFPGYRYFLRLANVTRNTGLQVWAHRKLKTSETKTIIPFRESIIIASFLTCNGRRLRRRF